MSTNNRIHAINAIAERRPDVPLATLPADTSLQTYGDDVFGEKEIRAFLPKSAAAKLLATVTTASRSTRPSLPTWRMR